MVVCGVGFVFVDGFCGDEVFWDGEIEYRELVGDEGLGVGGYDGLGCGEGDEVVKEGVGIGDFGGVGRVEFGKKIFYVVDV